MKIAAVCATALMFSGAAYPQESEEDAPEIRGSESFLAMPYERQVSWFQGNISGMANMLFFLDRKAGLCVLNWFGDDPEGRIANFLRSMREFPDQRPEAILIAYANRACGPFDRPKVAPSTE